MSRWDSKYDQECFFRANNPSRWGWVVLALILAAVLAGAAAVYYGAGLLSALSVMGG